MLTGPCVQPASIRLDDKHMLSSRARALAVTHSLKYLICNTIDPVSPSHSLPRINAFSHSQPDTLTNVQGARRHRRPTALTHVASVSPPRLPSIFGRVLGLRSPALFPFVGALRNIPELTLRSPCRHLPPLRAHRDQDRLTL